MMCTSALLSCQSWCHCYHYVVDMCCHLFHCHRKSFAFVHHSRSVYGNSQPASNSIKGKESRQREGKKGELSKLINYHRMLFHSIPLKAQHAHTSGRERKKKAFLLTKTHKIVIYLIENSINEMNSKQNSNDIKKQRELSRNEMILIIDEMMTAAFNFSAPFGIVLGDSFFQSGGNNNNKRHFRDDRRLELSHHANLSTNWTSFSHERSRKHTRVAIHTIE